MQLIEKSLAVDKPTTKQVLRVIEKQKQWEKEAMTDLLRDIRVRIVQAETDFQYEREAQKNEMRKIENSLNKRMHKSENKYRHEDAKAQSTLSKRNGMEKEIIEMERKIEQYVNLLTVERNKASRATVTDALDPDRGETINFLSSELSVWKEGKDQLEKEFNKLQTNVEGEFKVRGIPFCN